jgi:DNA polymerase-1
MSADYSQIELRIMAHLSGDKGLIHAFAENMDVHRATAAEVFGVTPESVSDDMRRAAKAINFGLIYGMSAFGLAKQLGSSVAAQEYVDVTSSATPACATLWNARARSRAGRVMSRHSWDGGCTPPRSTLPT